MKFAKGGGPNSLLTVLGQQRLFCEIREFEHKIICQSSNLIKRSMTVLQNTTI